MLVFTSFDICAAAFPGVEPGPHERRWAQFLVDSGAVLPEPGTEHAGRGRQRLFSGDELFIAVALRAFGQSKLPIELLTNIAKAMREGEKAPLKNQKFRTYVDQAIAGKCDLYMIFDPSRIVGGSLDVLANPEPWEKEKFFDDFANNKSVSNSLKTCVYMTPWLVRLQGRLTLS